MSRAESVRADIVDDRILRLRFDDATVLDGGITRRYETFAFLLAFLAAGASAAGIGVATGRPRRVEPMLIRRTWSALLGAMMLVGAIAASAAIIATFLGGMLFVGLVTFAAGHNVPEPSD